MKLSLIIFLFTSIPLFSQLLIEDKQLEFEYLSSRTVSKSFNLNSSSKSNSDELYKIEVKFKLKSLDKKEIDINKFSLVDMTNKLRFRPSDISYATLGLYMGYVYLLKDDIEYKKNISANYKPADIFFLNSISSFSKYT